jgi:hypothetical protein
MLNPKYLVISTVLTIYENNASTSRTFKIQNDYYNSINMTHTAIFFSAELMVIGH